MITKKVAICIPTYQRKDVIQEYLESNLGDYQESYFDIYIYDSSEDNSTEKLVTLWQEQCQNLYYVRMPSELHSNMKVYEIIKGYGLKGNYQYLWVNSDAVRWKKQSIERVLLSIQDGYDIIALNCDMEGIGDNEYTDKNAFFYDCAWHLTLYGAAILNIDTMLKNVDWKELTEKYNCQKHVNFSHIGFYFEQILKLPNFHAKYLSIKEQDMFSSPLKKFSGWKKDTFYVWCYCWPQTIKALPNYYQNKNKVIKKEGMYSGILRKKNLQELRKESLYNLQVFQLYKKDWSILTDVPKFYLFLLAIIPPRLIEFVQCFLNKWDRKIKINYMKKFCKKNHKIYLYGAGKVALRYASYLEKWNVIYEGFVVTHRGDMSEVLAEHQVLELSEIDLSEKPGIILALNKYHQKEVLQQLNEIGYTHNVFSIYIIP